MQFENFLVIFNKNVFFIFNIIINVTVIKAIKIKAQPFKNVTLFIYHPTNNSLLIVTLYVKINLFDSVAIYDIAIF